MTDLNSHVSHMVFIQICNFKISRISIILSNYKFLVQTNHNFYLNVVLGGGVFTEFTFTLQNLLFILFTAIAEN